MSPENDIHDRMFAPAVGVAEDPASGFSNGCLTSYLVRNEYFVSCEIDVSVEQGYEMGRPAQLLLRANNTDGEIEGNAGGSDMPLAQDELLP